MPDVRHPAFPEIVETVPDDQLEDRLAKDWVVVDQSSEKPKRTKK